MTQVHVNQFIKYRHAVEKAMDSVLADEAGPLTLADLSARVSADPQVVPPHRARPVLELIREIVTDTANLDDYIVKGNGDDLTIEARPFQRWESPVATPVDLAAAGALGASEAARSQPCVETASGIVESRYPPAIIEPAAIDPVEQRLVEAVSAGIAALDEAKAFVDGVDSYKTLVNGLPDGFTVETVSVYVAPDGGRFFDLDGARHYARQVKANGLVSGYAKGVPAIPDGMDAVLHGFLEFLEAEGVAAL